MNQPSRQPDGHSSRWRLTGGGSFAPVPPLVAGIVNITPDSFSDGGLFYSPEAALKRVRRIVDEGADIVDLGAESTRPGADEIGPDEEWRRLRPALEGSLALRASMVAALGEKKDARPPFAVSVDTFRAKTAAKALATGHGTLETCVDIINDVSGGALDPAMPEVLAEFKPGYVLGHCPGRPSSAFRPRYGNVVDELQDWFTARMTALVKSGLPEECICLDPCIGFGKNLEDNLAICAAVPRLIRLGRPLYFGVSRKRFLASLRADSLSEQQSAADMRARDASTQAAVALLAGLGVTVHRVHQVADTRATLALVQAFRYRMPS